VIGIEVEVVGTVVIVVGVVVEVEVEIGAREVLIFRCRKNIFAWRNKLIENRSELDELSASTAMHL